MEINQVLYEYGLSEKETKVYLVCLKLGIASVYKIAEASKLAKSTTYDILNSLIKKGLVSYVIRDKKKQFEAGDPKKIISDLEDKKAKISVILPELEQLRKITYEKPTVELYEGKEGLKTILVDVINTKKEFLIIGNFGHFSDFFKHYSDLFVKKRVKSNIACRLIEEKSKENIYLKRKDFKELRKTKFLKGLEISNEEPKVVYTVKQPVDIESLAECLMRRYDYNKNGELDTLELRKALDYVRADRYR